MKPDRSDYQPDPLLCDLPDHCVAVALSDAK